MHALDAYGHVQLVRSRMLDGMADAGEGAPCEVEVVQLTMSPQWHWDAVRSELDALHDKGIIRLLDFLLVTSDPATGVTVRAHTRLSSEEASKYRPLRGQEGDQRRRERTASRRFRWEGSSTLLTSVDALAIADRLRPKEAALAVVFEHRWAGRLESLLRSGGADVVFDCMLSRSELDSLDRAVKSG